MAIKIAHLPSWQTMTESVHFTNDAVTVIGRLARSRKTGLEKEFTVLQYPDWVHVIAITPDRRVALVKQFRHGITAFTLELPGGAVDSGETHSEAAARELLEETGFTSDQWEFLGSVYANPAINTNQVHMWLANSVKSINDGEPDLGEELETVMIPLMEIVEMCHDDRILHPFTHSAVFRLIASHPQLFLP